MRIVLTLAIAISCLNVSAQAVLVPGSPAIQQQYINSEITQMNWYVMKGNERLPIGNVFTQFIRNGKQLMVITTVKMKQFTSAWTDTTIAELPSLKPVYHSSHNSQRDMALNFGQVVTGYYYDLMKKENTTISDTTHTAYFDSNLYPAIVRWLPIRNGYTASLAIYDYNPRGKVGVLKATIQSVTQDSIVMPKSGKQYVWAVKVVDEIAEGSASTYYVDPVTRRLLRQDIKIPGRLMVMELEEQ
ncbi:MAG TPA: hypothetical protein VLC28_00180 [Flavitalea sp.]|nr:hypothetical protein [Flavitalea sp.]